MKRLLIAVAILSGGCSMAAKGVMEIPTCRSDDECTLPELCIEEHCSVPAATQAELHVEVVPLDGPSQWFSPGKIDETHEFNGTLGAVVVVSGDVRPFGGGEPVPASIELVPTSWDLPAGRSAPVFRGDPCRTDPSRWCVSVSRGTYAVRVNSEGFAPFETEVDVENEDVALPIELPEQVAFSGRVSARNGGISGISVRAYAVSDARPVSTQAITGPCELEGEGCFVIQVPVTETDFTLRVSAGDGPLVPTLDFPRSEDIVLEDYGPTITVSGWVEGPGGSTDRVPNAGISFHSKRLGPGGTELSGHVEAATSVGLDGSFSIDLLAGEYEAQVVPPGDERFESLGVLVEDKLISGSGDPPTEQNGMTFALEPRSQFGGELHVGGIDGLGPGGVAIDALAGAQLWSAPDAFESESSHRSVFGATEADGTFSLAVDAGHYDIYFRPPLGTAASWRILRAVDLQEPLASETPLLTGGSVFVGAIDDASGAPLVGATLRIYADVASGSVQIGEAVTDDAGSYLVFLPAVL